MPFRQTERLPHEQNKKAERELVLKTAPRKRQRQQMQRPNYGLHFLGCTASHGHARESQGPSSSYAGHSCRDVPSLSANHQEKWTSGCPCHSSWALPVPEQRHCVVLLLLPRPRSSPAAPTLSLMTLLEVRFVMGAAGCRSALEKKSVISIQSS